MTGFIAVACERCDSPADEALIGDLRETVRDCPHAVLVASGCLLGRTFCQARHRGLAGGIVMVQPCSPDQRPSGPATLLGPLRARADIAAVCAWLRDGMSNSVPLPAHLFGIRSLVSRTPLN